MKFQKGNAGGPGRPPKAVEADYATAVKQAVTPTALAEVMRTLTRRAKDGDVAAARLLLNYTVGLPVDTTVEARIRALEEQAHDLTTH